MTAPHAASSASNHPEIPDSSAAHLPSDPTAIRDAHDRLADNAAAHLRRCVEDHLRRPTRWSHEALCGASSAVWDQYVRELEERAGRAVGSFGTIMAPADLTPIAPTPIGELSPIAPRRAG